MPVLPSAFPSPVLPSRAAPSPLSFLPTGQGILANYDFYPVPVEVRTRALSAIQTVQMPDGVSDYFTEDRATLGVGAGPRVFSTMRVSAIQFQLKEITVDFEAENKLLAARIRELELL